MRSRFQISIAVFMVCVALFSGMAIVTIASNETVAPEDASSTYFPLIGSGFMSGGFVRVPFDRYLDGTPVTADTILTGDEFSDVGILLAGAPTGSYCSEATTTAILVPPHSVGGIDFTFLTSSRPDTSLTCSSVPVEIMFLESVSEVTIVFGGAAVEYVLTAYDADDNALGSDTQTAEMGAGTFDVTFSSGTSDIKRVTFGRELAVTAITEVIFRH